MSESWYSPLATCDHHRTFAVELSSGIQHTPQICVEHHDAEGNCVGHADDRKYGGAKEYWENVIETDLLPPGPVVVGNFDGVEVSMRPSMLVRDCCGAVFPLHYEWCRVGLVSEGQTVVRDQTAEQWARGQRGTMYLREDTVASDRTFENETRLH